MHSTPYRLTLLFVTLVPLPFAFVGQPLLMIGTFTIVGSLFVPYAGATLLYLTTSCCRSRAAFRATPG